jgi:hypothetical protein
MEYVNVNLKILISVILLLLNVELVDLHQYLRLMLIESNDGELHQGFVRIIGHQLDIKYFLDENLLIVQFLLQYVIRLSQNLDKQLNGLVIEYDIMI